MRVSDYTEAVLTLVKEGKDSAKLLPQLAEVLKSRGHERLYPKILESLKRSLERELGSKRARITLAKESDGSAIKQEIVEALTKLHITDYTTTIDPNIVGGFIAEAKTERIDASYKKQLLTLYRSLTV